VQVDRRLHNRVLADLDVQVIRLKRQKQSISGRIEDVSQTGLCVILPCELHRDEMVKLKTADSTLFGYVVHSSWKRNAFRTGIEVEQVLLGGTDLAELLRSVLQATIPGVSLSS
jgi:PilZ domain